MYFGNYGLPKTELDQCLKGSVSEYPPKSNMANAPNHCSHLKDSTFTTFIDNGKSIVLQKVYISDMQNLKTVC